ncbi:UDP-galactopyranose mutase [Rudaeicoccus suwonensis]|uniref:UDP-galactopyranose mutase n=2 Tax=Rudaeicoccus suwonensis TaxID=657409 RepID=A0A561DVL4_9MICO|nr:UDP-galactopyranose mutase [Rudaeicoccus suwonensis]TWE07399.1 UDP-galactopyranose mutase [Rudaeicoccus suwonensis]
MQFGIAGAGFSGAVMARELAQAGHQVTVHESRGHVGGNCHTERDPDTGIMVHRYGPHIFHTGNERVWKYINDFGTMQPYNHRVFSTIGGKVYSLPVNLLTINQLFGRTLDPEQARDFISEQSDSSITDPRNFEEQALSMMGRPLYETFFLGYTRKQWGLEPTQIPASVLRRLPLRFTYEDSYFAHPYQAIPREGYTAIVERMLDDPRIEVHLSSPFDPDQHDRFDHTIWTGPLDAWFGHRFGRLGYRTLDFEEIRAEGDLQGCAVMNYGDLDVPFTRISEHKHFAPWEQHDKTVAFREFSRLAGEDDIPYYPVRLAQDKSLLQTYLDAAGQEPRVTFAGRLGTYRYLDMDVTIADALDAANIMQRAIRARDRIPALLAQE